MSQGSFDSTVEQFAAEKAQLREQYQALAISTLAGMRTRYASLTEIGTPEALATANSLLADIDEFEKKMPSLVDEAVDRVSGQGAKMIVAHVQETYTNALKTGEFVDGYGIIEAVNLAIAAAADKPQASDIADVVNESILATLKNALSKDDYNSIKNAAEELGVSIFGMLPQGVQSGLYSYLSDFLSSEDVVNYLGSDFADQVFESLGYGAWDSFSTAFADNTVNAQFGLSTGESVISGLSQNDWAGAGASDGASYANGFRSAAMNATKFHTQMVGGYAAVLRKKIKGYATGGYPKQGELFWAREDGAPEMVGKMGGNTAVANNEQIVTGISSGVSKGVSDANREQNALLREQNNLLRQLLQKQFTAQVSPSAEFGRVVAKSSRMYEKTYG